MSAPGGVAAAAARARSIPELDPSRAQAASSEALAELGAALGAGEANLEAESLVALAEARLNDVDAQIGSIMMDIQTRSDLVDGISERTRALSAVRQAMLALGAVEPGDKKVLAELEIEWEGELVYGDELLERYGIAGLEHSDGKIRLGVIDERVNQLKNESTQLNSGNELAMIRLQTLMSQRSQVIEMTTRMLSSLAESQMAIIRNLR